MKIESIKEIIAQTILFNLNSEREDITRARNVLMDIIERNSIPVFSDIELALKCAALHLKQVRQCWLNYEIISS